MTLGFDLVASGERTAIIEIVTDVAKHANLMRTVHVLCDIADAAIGTARVRAADSAAADWSFPQRFFASSRIIDGDGEG
jgi:hypothetical protein